MADPKEYSLNVKWAGSIEHSTDMYIVEIPAFGTFAQIHDVNRSAAIDMAELALGALVAAYQGQGLTLPPGDAGV